MQGEPATSGPTLETYQLAYPTIFHSIFLCLFGEYAGAAHAPKGRFIDPNNTVLSRQSHPWYSPDLHKLEIP